MLAFVSALSGCASLRADDDDAAQSVARVAQFAPLPLPTPGATRAADGRPGPGYWQQRADYTINAELLPDQRLVRATQTITYTNNSPHTLDYIWLDLSQNAFREDSRGNAAQERIDRFDATLSNDFGHRLGTVRINGTDVTPQISDTRAKLVLPSPLAPAGGRLTIDLTFEFQVPFPGSNRMGILEHPEGDIFELAQWFPHVIKYDDVHGWNTLPYLGRGEFYSDHGDYTLSITAPASMVVVATGDLQNPGEVFTPAQADRYRSGLASDTPVWVRSPDDVRADLASAKPAGTKTWRFASTNVRTVAFAAADSFCLDVAGVTLPSGRRVRCMSAFPPLEASLWGHMVPIDTAKVPNATDDERNGWAGSTESIRHAIEFYSAFFGYEFPDPAMTNVFGVEPGMEYPMIVFCGPSYFAKEEGQRRDGTTLAVGDLEDPEPKDRRNTRAGLFGVTDHEVLHTWFPMVVSNDERRHAWMDEGFNSFGNIYSGRAFEAKHGVREHWEEPDADAFGQRMRANAGKPAIMTPPDRVAAWGLVGYLMYAKTATGLYILRENILGHDRFDHAMHAYVNTWAYKSPQPADFFRAMENAAGEDLSYFWRGWFAESGTVDFAIDEIESRGGPATDDADAEPAVIEIEDHGDIPMPLLVRITYTDGTTQDLRVPAEVWYAGREHDLVFDTAGRRVDSAELDPEGWIPDVKPRNNRAR